MDFADLLCYNVRAYDYPRFYFRGRNNERQAYFKMSKNTTAKKSASAKTIAIIVCVAIVFVACIGAIVYNKIGENGFFYRNAVSLKSENYEVNNAMMQYFFNMQYQNYASTLQSMGVDTSKSLKDQIYTSDQSWFDWLMDMTVNNVKSMLVLCEAAKAEGFELTDADKAEMDTAMDSLKAQMKEYANQNGLSETYVLRAIYGFGLKYGDIRDAMELNQLASAYSTKLSDSFEYGESDFTAYLEENKADFEKVDYMYYTFTAKADEEEEAESTDTADTEDAEEETRSANKQEAYDLANNLAQKLKAAETAGDDVAAIFTESVKTYLNDTVYADEEDADKKAESVEKDLYAMKVTAASNDESSDFIKYAFSDDAKTEKVHFIGNDNDGKYFVYYITEGSYIEEYNTKNLRLITLTDANDVDLSELYTKVMDEIEASDKSEDAFAQIAMTYSQDASAASNGGLYENQGKNDAGISKLGEWLYDDSRKAGDIESFSVAAETADGTNYMYIAYFIGDGEVKWQRDANQALVSEAYAAKYTELEAQYTVDVDKEELYKIPSQAGVR